MRFPNRKTNNHHHAKNHAAVWIALLLTGAVHIAAFHAVFRTPLPLLAREKKTDMLTVRLHPIPPQQKDSPHSAPMFPVPDKHTADIKPAKKPDEKQAASSNDAATVQEMNAPSSTPAIASPSIHVDDMIESAKRSIGKIDKDLRKDAPWATPAPSKPAQSPLEKAIVSAGKPASPTLAEKTLSDGRRVTKVSGPGGTYCVLHGTVAASGGVDQIQHGIQSKVTNCANLFD